MPVPSRVLVLDVNTRLVDRLAVQGDLSQPSSFIIQRDGTVAYAYVGADMADRPSVEFILDTLDEMP